MKKPTGLLRYVKFDPPRARHSDPDTSHLAAESMQNGAGLQRLQIVRLLVTIPKGLNAGEIDEELGWPNNTAVRRMHELRRTGLIMPMEKRRTPIGKRLAYVYITTTAGREWCD